MSSSVAQPPVIVDDGDSDRARALARRLGLRIVADREAATGPCLAVGPSGLSLALEPGVVVVVDFLSGATARRGRGARQEALGRAIGVERGIRTVVDATAGLGRDAFLLATLGCEVLAFERDPIVAALLADGLDRAARHPAVRTTVGRIDFTARDAGPALDALASGDGVDAVYLDPMFPDRGKSALAKKEAQLLQALVGPAGDPSALLEQARAAARRRVVVKRPRTAPPIAEPVSHALTGRSVRFDVYLG